jgi:hypothetical protein
MRYKLQLGFQRLLKVINIVYCYEFWLAYGSARVDNFIIFCSKKKKRRKKLEKFKTGDCV